MDDVIKLTANITVVSQPENLDSSIVAKGVEVNKGLQYGEVEVIVTNTSVDRHGETIVMEGVDLAQIKRNPTVLYGHDYSGLPIGKITSIARKQGNLTAKISFDYDIDPFADKVYKKILRGSLNAVSIGGVVKEWNEDYTVIKKMEMVELSVVPVGAHPDALVTSKSNDNKMQSLEKRIAELEEKAKEPVVTYVKRVLTI